MHLIFVQKQAFYWRKIINKVNLPWVWIILDVTLQLQHIATCLKNSCEKLILTLNIITRSLKFFIQIYQYTFIHLNEQKSTLWVSAFDLMYSSRLAVLPNLPTRKESCWILRGNPEGTISNTWPPLPPPPPPPPPEAPLSLALPRITLRSECGISRTASPLLGLPLLSVTSRLALFLRH